MTILHELKALVVGYDMVTSHLPVEDGCTNWVDIQVPFHACQVTYRVKSEEEVVNGGVAEMKVCIVCVACVCSVYTSAPPPPPKGSVPKVSLKFPTPFDKCHCLKWF